MKICFASYPAVTLTGGGPFIKIKETKRYLEMSGHCVDLYDMWNAKQKMTDYDVVHLIGSNFAVFGLARSLNEKKIDFLVEPVFFTRHNSKYLQRVNSIDKLIRKTAKGIWFDYGIIRDICGWASLILPNTYSEAEIISKGFSIPMEKFEVVCNGVSERFLSGNPELFQKKYGIKDFILYVGHLGTQRKNGLSLIKALKGIDHPAVIIGSIAGIETEAILSEAKKNKNIILINALENDSEMLASAYSSCNTFVLPSQFETPGIAALEAGLAGANIVITPFGGTKEYFKDMAEYPDPNSIESIKHSIEKALNKPKDENLKNHIKNNFLWSKVTEKLIKVYENSVGKVKPD